MSWLPYFVPSAILLLLIMATALRRDLWPFSHYPMFAGYDARRALRFYQLRFSLPGEKTAALVTLEPNLGDEFDREFSQAWPEATGGVVPGEVVRRFWREAARRRPRLGEATQAEVVLRLAQLGPAGGVQVAESSVQVVKLTDAT